MNNVSRRSARYFYLLMKVLSYEKDKLTVKMTKVTHLYIMGNQHIEESLMDVTKVKPEINGVPVIYDEKMRNHLVLMDVKEKDIVNNYKIEIL